MISKSALSLSFVLVVACGPVHAQKDNPAAKDLANKNGCMSCHDIAAKVIGPSFKDVAEKYKGQKDAVAVLSKKVKEGGKGVWGRIPMPPHDQMKDTDIAAVVNWVLAQ